jgi:hypothetical protein
MQQKLLRRYRFEHGLAFEIRGSLLLPLVGSPHGAEVRKEQFHLHVEICVQILTLDIDLCAEQPDVVDLHLLLTVSNKKCARVEGALVLRDRGLNQVMMVDVSRAPKFALLLL